MRKVSPMTTPKNPSNARELQPGEVLAQMIAGFKVTQLIYVAAALNLADLLKEAPKRTEVLAHLIGVDREALDRVMIGLVSLGVFFQSEDGSFGLTSIGEYLESGVPTSLRPMALLSGEEWIQRMWGNLYFSVKTGEIAFDHVFGREFFGFLSIPENSQAARICAEQLESRTAIAADAVMAAYDFSPFDKVVHVGGGYGSLLLAILKAHRTLKGILFDLPHVIDEAVNQGMIAEVAERCECVSGDYFKAVPRGGNVYLLSQVIHSWGEEKSLKLLQNCHRAMTANGKLLLIERVIPTGSEVPFEMAVQSISLMLETGGRERNQAQFRELLQRAGFTLTRVLPTASPLYVLEGVRMEVRGEKV